MSISAKDTNSLSFHINHERVNERRNKCKTGNKKGKEKETVKRSLLSFVLSDFH